MKLCRKCKKEKPLTDFYINRGNKDNLMTACILCMKIYKKEYYRNNKEKVKEKSKIYKENNKDKISKRNKEYRKENVEKILEYKKQNKHRINYSGAKRRAKKINATPAWADQDKIKTVYKKAKELGELIGKQYDVDHIIPLNGRNVCGLHVWSNLQILEKDINMRKGNRL